MIYSARFAAGKSFDIYSVITYLPSSYDSDYETGASNQPVPATATGTHGHHPVAGRGATAAVPGATGGRKKRSQARVRTVHLTPDQVNGQQDGMAFAEPKVPSLTNPQSAGNELWRKKPEKEVPHGLPPDQAAWLPVARKVNTVGYKDMEDCLRQSLIIGLRSIDHHECRRAVARLTPAPKKVKKEEESE